MIEIFLNPSYPHPPLTVADHISHHLGKRFSLESLVKYENCLKSAELYLNKKHHDPTVHNYTLQITGYQTGY